MFAMQINLSIRIKFAQRTKQSLLGTVVLNAYQVKLLIRMLITIAIIQKFTPLHPRILYSFIERQLEKDSHFNYHSLFNKNNKLPFMSSAKNNNYLPIEVKLIEAELFQKGTVTGTHYSATVIHQLTHYQTSIFPVTNNKINFTTTTSIVVEPSGLRQTNQTEPLLKIILSSTGTQQKLQTVIDQRTLTSLLEEELTPQKRSNKKKKVLSYPLMAKARNIAGEIKLSFSFWKIQEEKDFTKSSRFSLSLSRHSNISRKKVYSNRVQTYFQPFVSQAITVNTDDSLEQSYLQKYQTFKSQRKMHQNLQISSPHNEEESSYEYLSSSSTKENKNISQLSPAEQKQIKQAEQKKCQDNKPNEEDKTKEETEELPEDYKYLFHKINQINQKYAPLEKIPSIEELSEEGTLPQKQQERESFYSMNSDFQEDKNKISQPLQQAKEFIKQLNLYKLGKDLAYQSSEGAQTV